MFVYIHETTLAWVPGAIILRGVKPGIDAFEESGTIAVRMHTRDIGLPSFQLLGNSTIELGRPLSRRRQALERLNACAQVGWLCVAVAACGEGAADPDDTSAPGDCSAPAFASPELEAEVRFALSVRENDASLRERPLTAQELAGLTHLSTSSGVNVSSLDGLECFTSLELLSIDAGTFDSLEPLRGLESLTRVELYRSAVVDLSPITSSLSSDWMTHSPTELATELVGIGATRD